MKLYFTDSKGQDTLIKECSSIGEAIQNMIQHQNRCFVYPTGRMVSISQAQLADKSITTYTLYKDQHQRYWVDAAEEN